MKYISLGGNCCVSYQLKKLNIKKDSFPFDWSKTSINQIINVLENNFIDYSETLKFKKKSEKHNHKYQENYYSYILTNKYNISFAHEVINLSELIDFKDKIKRRIDRFKKLNDEKIFFIRIELSKLSNNYDNKIIKLYNLLNKYTNNFSFLLIIQKDNKININLPNLIIFTFNEFDEDWKMDKINWDEIIK